jgi:two-component system sensor histidine kinase/response regulator
MPAAKPSGSCDGDWEAFVERLGGDRMLAREMARAFVSDAPRLLAELQAAAHSGDLDAMRRAAHALKGAAGNFAAAETVAVASQLEQTARDGDLTTALALVDRLAGATTQLVTRLRTFEGSEPCAS